MENLISKTIGEIKKQKIVPVPRWKYLMKKYAIWAVFAGTIFFGAISFSIAFDMLRQLDWDLYRFVHQSALVYSLTLVPYFWIVCIAIFLALAFFDLRKTETGYRYGWFKISLASISGIIIAGAMLSLSGVGNEVNLILKKDIPYYGQHMIMTKEKQWMQPDSGFLAGTLTNISSDKLEIVDLAGQKWNVLLDEQTLIRPAVSFKQGEMIKIIGSKVDKNNFRAIEIRPWMGQGISNGSGVGRGMGNGGAGMMRDNYTSPAK